MFKVVGKDGLKRCHLVSWEKAHPEVPNTGYKLVNENDLRGLSDPQMHKKAVNDAVSKINNRAGIIGKALALFAVLQPDLEIICWPGVPGEFACAEEYPGFTAPTIMWDPYRCFEYYAREQRNRPKVKGPIKAKIPRSQKSCLRKR